MTGFRGVRNANGRPKGALNKTSIQTKELIEKLVSSELKNIDGLLEQLEPKERVDAIIKLLAYVIPKNSHIEIDSPIHHQLQPIVLTVIEEPLKLVANEKT
jgi:hypothetical protein